MPHLCMSTNVCLSPACRKSESHSCACHLTYTVHLPDACLPAVPLPPAAACLPSCCLPAVLLPACRPAAYLPLPACLPSSCLPAVLLPTCRCLSSCRSDLLIRIWILSYYQRLE
jgi:hypothetical protein